jgi:hypothetical protein
MLETAIGNRFSAWQRGARSRFLSGWSFRPTPTTPRRRRMPTSLAPETTTMLYKTIVLELIQEQSDLHERLRTSRTLLPTMNSYASELKNSHDGWKKRLIQAKPGCDPRQIASQALEIALEELKERLRSASEADETEPLSLDATMNYLLRHTPPA